MSTLSIYEANWKSPILLNKIIMEQNGRSRNILIHSLPVQHSCWVSDEFLKLYHLSFLGRLPSFLIPGNSQQRRLISNLLPQYLRMDIGVCESISMVNQLQVSIMVISWTMKSKSKSAKQWGKVEKNRASTTNQKIFFQCYSVCTGLLQCIATNPTSHLSYLTFKREVIVYCNVWSRFLSSVIQR